MKKLLSYDPLNDVTQYWHQDPYDPEAGWIETVQHVGNQLECAKAIHASVDEHARWGEGQHVAHIPALVMHILQKQGIMSYQGEVVDPKRFTAWLNDPENRNFRVRPGRV